MRVTKNKLKQILNNESGQEVIEYALMLALILLVCAFIIYRMSGSAARSVQTQSSGMLLENSSTDNSVQTFSWFS